MRDQFVKREQFLFAFTMELTSFGSPPPPAFSASVASLMMGSEITSPAISQSVMKRSTVVGKLTANTP